MVFCNLGGSGGKSEGEKVTILILVDGFLQSHKKKVIKMIYKGHNPYFSRWFSAIVVIKGIKTKCIGHNPYFSRWFSAIRKTKLLISIIY